MQLLTRNLHAYYKQKQTSFHESAHSPFSLSLIAKAGISAVATIGPVITHLNRNGKTGKGNNNVSLSKSFVLFL